MTAAAGADVIRKRRKGLQSRCSPAASPSRPQTLAQPPGRRQTKAAWREAKKLEAQLLEQVDRGEQRAILSGQTHRVERRCDELRFATLYPALDPEGRLLTEEAARG